MVHAGYFKFRHIPVHPCYNLVVVFFADFGVVHIPAGKLFGKDFVENIVLVQGNGFMNSTLRVSLGRDYGAFPDFTQGRGQGKEFALQVIIVLKTVISPGRVQNPVSDVNKVQESTEFFRCQIDLHNGPPLIRLQTIIITSVLFFQTFL